MKKTLNFVCLAVAVALVAGQSAQASCASQTMQEYIDRAEVITQATVTSRMIPGRTSFVVEKYYKGNLGRTFTLTSAFGVVTSVDVDWEKGETYLVFIERIDGKLTSNTCSGSRLWADRPSEIDLLVATDPSSTAAQPAAAVVILAGTIIGIGVLRWWGKHDPTRTG